MIGSTPRTITEAGLASCSSELLPVDSVLFSSRAPIGHVAINTVPMATNQGFKSFVPIAEKLDPRFLYHWLKANKAHLKSLGNGATFKEVSKEVVSRISIPLPPVEEQRRIAAILDQAEALRAKRRQALAKLDTLTQSLFLEMFGSPFSCRGRYQTEALIRIVEGVFDCPHSTPDWAETGVRCLRTPDLGVGYWVSGNERFVSENVYAQRSRRAHLSPGDIVLSREGTVGIAAIVPQGMRACMGQRLVQIKPNLKKAIPEYLLWYLLQILSPERISHIMVGSTAQHLNVKELKMLKIPLPPLQLQQQFANSLAEVAAIGRKGNCGSEQLDLLCLSLQHRAFRGEL
jgi:type I restriction enzyme S subunit